MESGSHKYMSLIYPSSVDVLVCGYWFKISKVRLEFIMFENIKFKHFRTSFIYLLNGENGVCLAFGDLSGIYRKPLFAWDSQKNNLTSVWVTFKLLRTNYCLRKRICRLYHAKPCDRKFDVNAPWFEFSVLWTPVWISNYIHYKVRDKITYPFLNFNGATVEV